MVSSGSSAEIAHMILATVAQIPYGQVASYGQIAAMCGLPRHARLVGRVLSELDQGNDIPWHRVINAQGYISNGRLDQFGHNMQKQMLLSEGVTFKNDKVSFKQYGWQIREVDPQLCQDEDQLR